MQKKVEKKFLASEIIESELVSLISHYKVQDTCRRQPMC